MTHNNLAYLFFIVFCSTLNTAARAEDTSQKNTSLDPVSVTATRTERASKDVPAAVSVIDEQRLETTRMFNLSEALGEEPGVLMNSKNGGYDARLIIRGAGLKANFGIREIMMLRDGVPITDPDSFTRLDFIDTQDIERIEVTRGPGNLYAAGSAGGTVQIISKSVFDMSENTARIGAGNFGAFNAHARYAGDITDNQAGAVTFSRRQTDNEWRRNNEFDTSQMSFKHGIFFGADNVLESELAYTEANLQLPGKMNDAQYEEFLQTGEQTNNDNAFKHTARDSKIWSFNSRMEIPYKNFTYTPRIYANEYSQFHPVTGQIVETPGSLTAGVDLEVQHPHMLGGMAGDFAGGVTYRAERSNNDQRYAYADVVTIPAGPQAGRIIRTLSDRKGDLIEVQNTRNVLYGFFVGETLQLSKRLKLDASARVDKAVLDQDINEMQRYDYASGKYVPGVGQFSIDRDFNLWSPRVGLSYAITKHTNAFMSLAQADQVPFEYELENNPTLDKSTVRNLEFGFKGRDIRWTYDVSVYWSVGKDEIVPTLENGETLFNNAGGTDKNGLELATAYEVVGGLRLGLNYAFSDYTYDSFTEIVSGVPVDRSGNTLPFIPRHKYTLFADYRNRKGVTARISSDTWGSYWVDNANSEKYEGYKLVTSLFVGWEKGAHKVGLNVDNVFDKRYAIEVTKDTRGNLSYAAGTPRSFLLSYTYAFNKQN